MVKCIVSNCGNYDRKKDGEKVKYFSFPSDKTMSAKWLKACGKVDKFNVKSARICSKHFLETDYRLKDQLLNTCVKKKQLKKTSIPSQYLPQEENITSRDLRQQDRNHKRILQEAFESYEK